MAGDRRLYGKKCVVSGAGQGIGLAVAKTFLDEGADVFAIDLEASDLSKLQHAGLTIAARDVTDVADVAQSLAEFPAADVLVNCVGWVAEGTVLDCTPDILANAMQLNIGSMVNMIRAWLPGMQQRRSGSIINIASVASSVSGLPNRCAYATTKAGVIGLTKSVARDFIGDGIRCNAISPGTVFTPSLEARIGAADDPVKAMEDFVARQPMGRLGEATEIAQIALLLASDEARFMTGENIIVDGGLSL